MIRTTQPSNRTLEAKPNTTLLFFIFATPSKFELQQSIASEQQSVA